VCIYGINSPGGYQLVGRTLRIWNKLPKNAIFIDERPWLLQLFDQVRFYQVTKRELDVSRNSLREGRLWRAGRRGSVRPR
jgi:urea carboxylase